VRGRSSRVLVVVVLLAELVLELVLELVASVAGASVSAALADWSLRSEMRRLPTRRGRGRSSSAVADSSVTNGGSSAGAGDADRFPVRHKLPKAGPSPREALTSLGLLCLSKYQSWITISTLLTHWI